MTTFQTTHNDISDKTTETQNPLRQNRLNGLQVRLEMLCGREEGKGRR